MAGGTRSGRFQKDDDTNNQKAEDTNNLKIARGEVKDDIKGSILPNSSVPDTLNLRRSVRETPSKKKLSLSLSPQKSGREEKPTPSSSPDKMKFESAEKRSSSSSDKRKFESADKRSSASPLRRSERIEKIGISCSTSSKKSSSSSSSPDKSNRKEDQTGKLKAAGTGEQSKEIKVGDLPNKRRRMDSRTYRAFLTPKVKRATKSEAGKNPQKEHTSQDYTNISGANDPTEIEDVRDDSQLREMHDLNLDDRCCEDLVEGSSSFSRDVTVESKNNKIFSTEDNECKDVRSSLVTKCGDSSSHFSPVTFSDKENHGTTAERATDGEPDRKDKYLVGLTELRASEIVEYTSRETSVSVHDTFSHQKTINLASKSSKTPLDKEISIRETCIENVLSLSPIETKTRNMEQNKRCCEPQRVQKNLCSDVSESRYDSPISCPQALKVKKNPFQKLLRSPDGFPPGLDNYHLDSVNLLRGFWHRSQNAVFMVEEERLVKSILFILALQSHTCRPFLVIATESSLSSWEVEFARLAPTINIVIYTGNKDVRKMILDVQFYGQDNCVMFQVLLTHPNAVIEDLELLDCISWEAMILDESQNSRVSKHFERLKHLSADFRLLLLSGQLKDSLAEYLNLLSFLVPEEKENYVSSLKLDSKDTVGSLAALKEKLADYLAYEPKPDSKFIEYWVPVRLSNVQLEQYCCTLLSNSIALRSSSRVDHVGALRDLLISTRKCCDHPYIVDTSLQSSLTKDLPLGDYLDIGVNASGKLFLLDRVLKKIKNQGHRVLILFQQSVGGDGRNSIGDILDDFLRQRFGADSYERLDGGLVASKKQAALNLFNGKVGGRFVFLIEKRACLPSVKLASVDAAIIFDSDWNPLNDLRALQKIKVESQFEQLKVFRLYSTCTVEEKVLVLAKQDIILESNMQSVNPSVSHSLLSWGASYLFGKLGEFHQHDKLVDCAESSNDKAFVNDVVSAVLTLIPDKAAHCHTHNCSLLTRAQHSGVSYSRNIVLVGEEKEGIFSFDKDPSSLWSKLFEGRYPRWRYISQSSQRPRRKVQSSVELAKGSEAENDEGMMKRRKTLFSDVREPYNLVFSRGSNQSSPAVTKKMIVRPSTISQKSGTSEKVSANTPIVGSEGVPCSPSGFHASHNLHVSSMSERTQEAPKQYMVESEAREKFCNSQKDIYLMLKPELSKLCGTLKLPEHVKSLSETLLEYVMNNLHVSREPQTILRAFILALCWRAASLLKHTMDHKQSLALAKEYSNFECDEDQAISVYSKLRILKRKFSSRIGALKDDIGLANPESRSLTSALDSPKETLSCDIANPVESYHQVSKGDKACKIFDGPWSIHDSKKDHVNDIEAPAMIQENIESLKGELLKKQIDLIKKISSRRVEQFNLNQKLELSDFIKEREEDKMKLKKVYHSQLNHEFSQKMASFDQHYKFQRRKLALLQEDARNKESQIKDRWFEEAKAGRPVELFDDVPLSDSGFILEHFMVSEETYEDPVKANHTVRPSSDYPCHDVNLNGLAEPGESAVEFSVNQSLTPNGVVSNMLLITEPPGSQCNGMIAEECSMPTGISTGVPGSVSSHEACGMTVETISPAIHLPAMEGDLLNGEEENVTVETEASASDCENITEVEETELSLENSVASLPRTTMTTVSSLPDLPVETVSSSLHPHIVNAEGNMRMASSPRTTMTTVFEQDICEDASGGPNLNGLAEPGDSVVEFSVNQSLTPNGGVSNMLVISEPPDSQCNGMIVEECSMPTGISTGAPGSVSPQEAWGMIVESISPNIHLPGMEGDLFNGEEEDVAVETEASASDCERITEVEETELSLENPVASLPRVTSDLPVETVSSSLHPHIMNDEGNMHMASSPRTTMTTVFEQDISEDASGASNLIFSPRSGTKLPSSDNSLEQTNQVPCDNEHGRPNSSDGMETVEAFCSPPQNTVPVFDDHERLDVHMETDHACSLRDAVTGSELDEHSVVEISRDFILSEERPSNSNNIHDNQRKEQHSTAEPLLQVGQSDQAGSYCDVNPLPNSANTASPLARERSARNEKDVPDKQIDVQLSIIDRPVPVTQPAHLVSQCDVNSLPNHVTASGEAIPKDISSDRLHHSTNDTELQQPVPDRYVLVEQSNQVFPVGLSNENDSLDQQTYAQQSIFDPPVQDFQSDQPVSHCDGNSLPNHVTTPGETFPENISSEELHHYTRESEVSMQQQVSDTYPLVEQSNQVIPDDRGSLLSDTNIPGRTCFENFSNIYYRTTGQTEAVVPLPTSSLSLQLQTPDQLISEVNAANLGERCSGILNNTGSQTCSPRQTDLLMQQSAEAANVLNDQYNLVGSRSVVRSGSPSVTIPEQLSQSEAVSNTNVRTDCGTHSVQFMNMLNWTPPQGPHFDPLQNELMKLRRQKDYCMKLQEDKKLQLQLQRNMELEMVRRKYDALLQESEAEFSRDNRNLDTIYNKIEMNRILAEQFRVRFIENRGVSSSPMQGPSPGSGAASRSSYMQHLIHASQPQNTQRPISVSPSTLVPNQVTLPTAARIAPPTQPSTSLASGRLRESTLAVSTIAPAPTACENSSNSSNSNAIRPHLGSTLPARVGLQVGSEPRARPPHLQRLSPYLSMSAQDLLLQAGGVTDVQLPVPSCHPTPSGPSPSSMLPPAAASVTSLGPGLLPFDHGHYMPLNGGVSNVGSDMSKIATQMTANTAFAGTRVHPSPDAIRLAAISDVVCISDDED